MAAQHFACSFPDNLTAGGDYDGTEANGVAGDEAVYAAVDATLGRRGRIPPVKMSVDAGERA